MHQPKDIYWLGGYMLYVLPLTTSLCLMTPPSLKLYTIILACNCNYLYLFILLWLLILKTDKYLLLLWLCNYYSFNTIVIMIVQQTNNRILYHQN